MSISRRQLLKILAATPVTIANPLTNKALLRAIVAPPPASTVFLFFHGFFFFDVQSINGKDALLVGAPYYKYHKFLHRDQGANQLDPIPQQVWDLTTDLTGATVMPKWPREILNFSKSGIMHDVVPRTWSSAFGCILVLPCPSAIKGIRDGGDITDFTMGGNIASRISAVSGPNLSLITRLQYTSSTRKTHHFHAEHCDIPNEDEIAEMLNTARSAFGGEFQKKFDLTMTRIPVTSASTAATDDEKNLPDLAGMTGNPCKSLPQPSRSTGQSQQIRKSPKGAARNSEKRLIRTANCPMFGMSSS